MMEQCSSFMFKSTIFNRSCKPISQGFTYLPPTKSRKVCSLMVRKCIPKPEQNFVLKQRHDITDMQLNRDSKVKVIVNAENPIVYGDDVPGAIEISRRTNARAKTVIVLFSIV